MQFWICVSRFVRFYLLCSSTILAEPFFTGGFSSPVYRALFSFYSLLHFTYPRNLLSKTKHMLFFHQATAQLCKQQVHSFASLQPNRLTFRILHSLTLLSFEILTPHWQNKTKINQHFFGLLVNLHHKRTTNQLSSTRSGKSAVLQSCQVTIGACRYHLDKRSTCIHPFTSSSS